MQLDIMLFFQSVRSDFLDVLMNTISLFGEILIPLAVITIIYWCIDKKKGFVITLSILTALMTTQIVKSIVRYPRPFQAYPELIQTEIVHRALTELSGGGRDDFIPSGAYFEGKARGKTGRRCSEARPGTRRMTSSVCGRAMGEPIALSGNGPERSRITAKRQASVGVREKGTWP